MGKCIFPLFQEPRFFVEKNFGTHPAAQRHLLWREIQKQGVLKVSHFHFVASQVTHVLKIMMMAQQLGIITVSKQLSEIHQRERIQKRFTGETYFDFCRRQWSET